MKIHHAAIICAERERSLRFYGALGFCVSASHVRPERRDEILMLKSGETMLELFIDPTHPPRVSGPEAMGLRHIALEVPEGGLPALREELLRAGYAPEAIRRDTYTGEAMTFVKDPDGQPIELHEKREEEQPECGK